jgi:hypothetical protein
MAYALIGSEIAYDYQFGGLCKENPFAACVLLMSLPQAKNARVPGHPRLLWATVCPLANTNDKQMAKAIAAIVNSGLAALEGEGTAAQLVITRETKSWTLPDEARARGSRPAIPGWSKTRSQVLALDGFTCRRCRVNGEDTDLHIHHIRQKKHGGTEDLSNLITLCLDCHKEVHRRQDQAGTSTGIDFTLPPRITSQGVI